MLWINSFNGFFALSTASPFTRPEQSIHTFQDPHQQLQCREPWTSSSLIQIEPMGSPRSRRNGKGQSSKIYTTTAKTVYTKKISEKLIGRKAICAKTIDRKAIHKKTISKGTTSKKTIGKTIDQRIPKTIQRAILNQRAVQSI